MQIIYLTFLMCIMAVGTFIAGVYAKQLAAFYKRLFTRKKRKSTDVAALEEQVNNLAERLSTKDRNFKSNIRREVRDYLKELQK